MLGVGVALAAPVGDLFESFLKREAARKDSGGLFGAHGGALDRLDARAVRDVVGYYIWAAYVHYEPLRMPVAMLDQHGRGQGTPGQGTQGPRRSLSVWHATLVGEPRRLCERVRCSPARRAPRPTASTRPVRTITGKLEVGQVDIASGLHG